MGPADEVTSHLYSFGIRGKQFQYVEGKLPEGFPFHGRLTDHDVRNLQARGAEVLVLESHYTADDLKQARDDCRGETGKTPIQSEAKSGSAPITPASASVAGVSTANSAEVQAGVSSGRLSVGSEPSGADIEVDGSFVGNTPSEVQVSDGEHTISVKKAGFTKWERKLKVSAGSNIHLNAELQKESQ